MRSGKKRTFRLGGGVFSALVWDRLAEISIADYSYAAGARPK